MKKVSRAISAVHENKFVYGPVSIIICKLYKTKLHLFSNLCQPVCLCLSVTGREVCQEKYCLWVFDNASRMLVSQKRMPPGISDPRSFVPCDE